MDCRVVSAAVDTGGLSQVVAISGTSAQSSVLTTVGGVDALVTPTVDCFVRQGANPTALSNGTDMILLGGNTYRLSGIASGNRLAFITSGAAGSVFITPLV